MIARLALIVIMAACSAPSPAARVVTNRRPSVRPTAVGCPDVGYTGEEWLHEVFPGCPPMPFAYRFPLCVGECPRPSRARWISPQRSRPSRPFLPPTETRSETYEYDAKGNLVARRRDTDVDACAYEGGRIASCGDGYQQWQRRDDGRLVAMLTGSKHELWMTVTYDGRGDAREVVFPGDSTHRFTYDADHRMLQHHRLLLHDGSDIILAFTYEAGRLVSEETPSGHKLFSYDDRGRLIRVEERAAEGVEDYNDAVTLGYDDQDRVVNIVEDPRKYGGPETTIFDYD